MRYLLLRNEGSVRDVADKAYKGLSDNTRIQAEAALLKANPELKTFNSVRKGFIVRIPSIRDDGELDRRNLFDPVEDIAHEMIDKLKLFENTLNKEFSNSENRHKSILETLKSANKELKKHPNGDEVAKILKTHLTSSKKLHDKNKKLGLEALKKLQITAADFKR